MIKDNITWLYCTYKVLKLSNQTNKNKYPRYFESTRQTKGSEKENSYTGKNIIPLGSKTSLLEVKLIKKIQGSAK